MSVFEEGVHCCMPDSHRGPIDAHKSFQPIEALRGALERIRAMLGMHSGSIAGLWLLPKARGGSLDAKVFMGAARVVAGCEDEASVCLASTARPDHR